MIDSLFDDASFYFALVPYAVPLFLLWAFYAFRRSQRTAHATALIETSIADGLMQPASLHPVINPLRCLGCATCVSACPEKNVLGLVQAKAQLIQPANCIGHGACKDACPTDAIALVLGTEERGIDIPVLKPNFETNVPGVFVAGELGGMGLIRNGIEQGRQAMDAISAQLAQSERPHSNATQVLDVAIVGAGPAGFSATLAAKEKGLRAITLEQESLGGTVAHYPRGKVVMTAPVDLPIYGKVKLRETTKEALLELWTRVAAEVGISIRYEERVESISRAADGSFKITTNQGAYQARSILLAIGRRGTPRKLGVSGEESSRVVYRLIDPEQYRGQRVLVVGGGDSALEAACSLADTEGTQVAISYRGSGFGRAKAKNRARIEEAVKAGRLELLLKSEVRHIHDDRVAIATPGGDRQLDADAVIVCAGGILPTRFLEEIGIRIETRHGEVLELQ